MRVIIAAALALALTGCAEQKQQALELKTKADDAIAGAREEINMACWAMQTADVAFRLYFADKADPALLDAVAKAVAVANAICPPNEVPANLQEALVAISRAYKMTTSAAAITPGI